jgi:hypothetical protein
MPPFSGGYSPSPERTGGGDAGNAAPRVQRIFESLAARRGSGFDQTLGSVVGAENLALARALDADLYGTNERQVNELNPATATVQGLLPRWEKIFGVSPLPSDPQSVRQARVVAAAQRTGQRNNSQGVIDALQLVLGDLFVQLVSITPADCSAFYPALGGDSAYTASVAGNLVTVAGLASVPSSSPESASLVLANMAHSGNNGEFPIHSWVSASEVVVVNNEAPVAGDYGVGGTSPTNASGQWSVPNTLWPFTSTIAHLVVQVNPGAIPGYTLPSGAPSPVFFAAVNAMNPVLDLLLPADVTFSFYVNDSAGSMGFLLDEVTGNLDLEAFNP